MVIPFTDRSWNDGNSECRRNGYELWSVNSHEEWDTVYEKLAFYLNNVEIAIIGLQASGDAPQVSNTFIEN